MADHYKHIDNKKVVLSIQGQQAIQYVSDDWLRRCGQQVIQAAAAEKATEAADKAATAADKAATAADAGATAAAGPNEAESDVQNEAEVPDTLEVEDEEIIEVR